MSRTLFRCLAVFAFASTSSSAFAMVPSAIDFDSSFGRGAAASIARVRDAASDSAPFGFLRLSLSGNYLMWSARWLSGSYIIDVSPGRMTRHFGVG